MVQLVGRALDSGMIHPKVSVVVNGEAQECICPHCRGTISARIEVPDPLNPVRPHRAPPVRTNHDFGYTSLMYGADPAYFAGALVTGWSLQHHTSVPLSCRILLCTDDVPPAFRSVLSAVWTIRDVAYINKASPWFYWDYRKSRFKQVFTKLRVLKEFSGEFKKVILLDLDLLIRGEMDSLFKLPAPAAMVRGQCALRHGDTVPIDTFYSGHRQVLGINCGVMLVEPNAAVFDKMLAEVEEHNHPEHWPSHGPEQDYLSRYYNAFGQWTNMSCRYNYQVHLTQYGSLEWHHYNVQGHPDVSVFHFSGRLVKPWQLILDLRIAHGMEYADIEVFVKRLAKEAEESLRKHLNGENKVPKASGSDEEFIESHFCYGTGPAQIKAKRCFLDRYVHPSWSEADSDAAIEWIRVFREADEAIGGAMTEVLLSLWEKESSARSQVS